MECNDIQPVHPKGNQPWLFIGSTDAEAEAPILWPPDVNWLIRKVPEAGKDWRQEEKGMTEDEMVGWYGKQNDGNHPIRRAERKINLRKRNSEIFKTTLSIPKFALWVSRKEKEREGDWKCIWRNYDWKLPKPIEGNRYPGTGITEFHT